MRNTRVLLLVRAAMIAAIYVVLTYFISAFNLASGAVQVRISEALTVLPFFTAAAVPGLALGCFISNLLTGGAVWDVIFGSLATLLGAIGTRLLTRGTPDPRKCRARRWRAKSWRAKIWLAPLPPIVSNTVILPFVLRYAYGIPGSIPYFMLTVGIGEILSCGVLGMLLLHILLRYERTIFPENES